MLSRIRRSLRTVSGPMVLVIWQAAPETRFTVTLAHDNTNWEAQHGIGGGMAAAWEGPTLGVGGGFVVRPPADSSAKGAPPFNLSLYFRLGPLDRLHFQAYLRGAGPAGFLTGSRRVGIGWNHGFRPGPSLFGGAAECGLCDLDEDEEGRRAGFAELGIPLGSRFDLLGYALIGRGDTRAFGAGIRTRF